MSNRNKLQFKRLDYEYRDLDNIPIPLDRNTGLFTSPFVQMVGGKDDNDAVMPFKVDSTGRLDVVGVCPTHQADILLDQANPTSGTNYEVLETTELVRIVAIAARTTFTVKPLLEVHLVIDGQTITFSEVNSTTNTWYSAYIFPNNTEITQGLQSFAFQEAVPFLLEGRSVQIGAEATGGTVSALQCRLKWARW